MPDSVQAGGDVSTSTYQVRELQLGDRGDSKWQLPPCPSCGDGEWMCPPARVPISVLRRACGNGWLQDEGHRLKGAERWAWIGFPEMRAREADDRDDRDRGASSKAFCSFEPARDQPRYRSHGIVAT
jgi:hypothetical protein